MRVASSCVPLTCIGLLAACSLLVDYQLRGLSQSPSTVVVVRDEGNVCWALPGSSLKRIGRGQVRVAPDTRFARCSATGPAHLIGRELIKLRATGGGRFQMTEYRSESTTDGKKEAVQLSSCLVAATVKDMDLRVKQIVYSETPTAEK